ncbi:hypothetical protein BRARA_C04398 [Brassica rapa]|uniref:Uncharacterized protein n=1 Tax=Brassica campestris TaxID=3711 RepID=A0A398A6E3_BRACM|nr:hypothetical protein BRARA_C04398 [Brassica rapa]
MDAPERCERFVVPEDIELESLLYNLLHLLLEIVRVRTTNQSSPMQAYNQAINDLDKELDTLKNQFEAEMAKFSDH